MFVHNKLLHCIYSAKSCRHWPSSIPNYFVARIEVTFSTRRGLQSCTGKVCQVQRQEGTLPKCAILRPMTKKCKVSQYCDHKNSCWWNDCAASGDVAIIVGTLIQCVAVMYSIQIAEEGNLSLWWLHTNGVQRAASSEPEEVYMVNCSSVRCSSKFRVRRKKACRCRCY